MSVVKGEIAAQQRKLVLRHMLNVYNMATRFVPFQSQQFEQTTGELVIFAHAKVLKKIAGSKCGGTWWASTLPTSRRI